ncbi:hypothetical protein B0H19DRAFT_1066678 [Mycena capillaripes]|nr:hypothetical protein B0H19DRAFT_1066678 [Mycena capillaripes]
MVVDGGGREKNSKALLTALASKMTGPNRPKHSEFPLRIPLGGGWDEELDRARIWDRTSTAGGYGIERSGEEMLITRHRLQARPSYHERRLVACLRASSGTVQLNTSVKMSAGNRLERPLGKYIKSVFCPIDSMNIYAQCFVGADEPMTRVYLKEKRCVSEDGALYSVQCVSMRTRSHTMTARPPQGGAVELWNRNEALEPFNTKRSS